jgi:Rrf2 family protein
MARSSRLGVIGAWFMLSQKTKYALRALVYLAAMEGPSASIAEIAIGAKAPRKFLEAILLELKQAGFLESRRGRFGGYGLAAPPEKIVFADVIRAIEGPLALAPCASRTAYRPCHDCFDVETCPIRAALLASRDAVAGVLEGWSLATALQSEATITKSLVSD